MENRFSVKKGYSSNPDAAKAISEIKEAVDQPDLRAVILFCTSKADLDTLGREIEKSFSVPVIGCTTSGEIAPDGYPEGTISAAGLAGGDLEVRTHFIENVREFGSDDSGAIAEKVKETLTLKKSASPDTKAFGLLLIDGLSVAEEGTVAHLYAALEDVPIIGGSAGDDLAFKETYIYHDGTFKSGGAQFAVFFTSLPFKTFKTQHFTSGEERMVITEAIPEKRIVCEINGLPAAEEYARFVGLEVDKLEPMTFSKYPVMLKIGGDYYVRSIQKVNDDGSLTFYCAIDEGLVLTLANGVDLLENLEKTFDDVRAEIPDPALIIGCECVLRRLEIMEKGIDKKAAALMEENNVVGFHTYGEQFNSVHVNQTFTGVAIGNHR